MYLQLFVLSSLTTWIYGQNRGCLLQVNTNKTDAPLFFHNSNGNLDMVRTEYGNVKLSRGERVTLACPGPRNYLKDMPWDSSSHIATCVSDAYLEILGTNVNFNVLQCSKSIRGDVRNTTKSCANSKGSIKEIGYQISVNQWVTLITICYEAATGITFYTKHDLDGREIKYAPKNINRPDFSVAGLEIAAAVAYNKTYQKSRFDAILASVSDKYINGTSYLARGHISPCADFVLAASRRASFYYINVIPQWQVINFGNWKTVELAVRKTAEKRNCTFTIITGTYEVLTLPDIQGTPKPIYLIRDDKLPVPLIVWKIVYDPLSGKGIAFLVINNPFLNTESRNYVFCTNICGLYGWGSANWSNYSKGYTYCCDVREFLAVVNTAPNLNVSGVLYAN